MEQPKIGSPEFFKLAQETFRPAYGAMPKGPGRPKKPRNTIDNESWTKPRAKLGRPPEHDRPRTKIVSLVSTDLYERVKQHAAMEGRSLSNLVARVLFDAFPEIHVDTQP